MLQECEQFKDELLTLVYLDEPKAPGLEVHLQGCSSCQQDLQELSSTVSFSHRLPDLNPPPHLTDKIFAQIAAPKSLKERIRLLFLHPASVGLTVFCLTLAGSFMYQRYSKEVPAPVAQNEKNTRSNNLLAASMYQPVAYQPNSFRMVGWQPTLRYVEDLDRPMLRHADLGSLEHASLEGLASFKHQLAMRHIIDGEYDKAHVVLNNIANNYMDYSHWEQAVLQHLKLMKSMGRDDDMRTDLSKLQEYAMATPDVIRQAQEVVED